MGGYFHYWALPGTKARRKGEGGGQGEEEGEGCFCVSYGVLGCRLSGIRYGMKRKKRKKRKQQRKERKHTQKN